MMNIIAIKALLFSLVALLSVSNGQRIYSPNYPENYPNNMDCSYTIRPAVNAEQWSKVNLRMHYFQTEAAYDYLEIYQGTDRSPVRNSNSSTTRWSGSVTGRSFQLYYPVVMRFRTDGSVVTRGFYFSYGAADRTSNLSFTCDRACSNISIDRQCGDRTNHQLRPTLQRCFNPCDRSWQFHFGVSCPKYSRDISPPWSRNPSFLIRSRQCYSLCQNRTYTSRSSECSNDNANLCMNGDYDYLPECGSRSSTPSPRRHLHCYNPCNQSSAYHYGVECPEYFLYISKYSSWSSTTYQCYSKCQNRYYASKNRNCSNLNANLCLQRIYKYLPECGRRPRMTLSCYNPCTDSNTRHEGSECPKYFRFVQSFKSYVTGDTTFECYSLCQKRYYTTKGANNNCSNLNAKLRDNPENSSSDMRVKGPRRDHLCGNLNHAAREECLNQSKNSNSSKPYEIAIAVMALMVIFCAIIIAGQCRKSRARHNQASSRINSSRQHQNIVHPVVATLPSPPPYETRKECVTSSGQHFDEIALTT